MDISQLVANLTPEVYERLRTAVETGKWFDGNPLSEEQRESCMQAVLMYQSQVIGSEEHMTVGADGNIVHKSKQQFKRELTNEETIARFNQDDI